MRTRPHSPRPLGALVALLAALSLGAAAAPAPVSATAGVRVIGGSAASWPFVAALEHRGVDAFDGQFCGGTVVAPQLVVTAAHCVDGETASGLDVLTGTDRLSDGAGQRIPVAAIDVEPAWDPTQVVHDIAVLRLASPTSAPALPIATPAQDAALTAPGATVSVAGWGKVAQNPDVFPDVLQAAPLTVQPNAACDDAYGGVDATLQICASAPGRDSCQGDSGGPLIAGDGASAVLVGIVSFGTATCANPDAPSVYTRVASETAWLAGELGTSAAPVPTPSPPKPHPSPPKPHPSPARTRIAALACGARGCRLDVTVSGAPATDRVVVHVRARRGRPRVAVARRIGPGRYRVRLPLLRAGHDTISAQPVDRAGRRTARAASLTVTFRHGRAH